MIVPLQVVNPFLQTKDPALQTTFSLPTSADMAPDTDIIVHFMEYTVEANLRIVIRVEREATRIYYSSTKNFRNLHLWASILEIDLFSLTNLHHQTLDPFFIAYIKLTGISTLQLKKRARRWLCLTELEFVVVSARLQWQNASKAMAETRCGIPRAS